MIYSHYFTHGQCYSSLLWFCTGSNYHTLIYFYFFTFPWQIFYLQNFCKVYSVPSNNLGSTQSTFAKQSKSCMFVILVQHVKYWSFFKITHKLVQICLFFKCIQEQTKTLTAVTISVMYSIFQPTSYKSQDLQRSHYLLWQDECRKPFGVLHILLPSFQFQHVNQTRTFSM